MDISTLLSMQIRCGSQWIGTHLVTSYIEDDLEIKIPDLMISYCKEDTPISGEYPENPE